MQAQLLIVAEKCEMFSHHPAKQKWPLGKTHAENVFLTMANKLIPI